MIAFIELDSAALTSVGCSCVHCRAAARSGATKSVPVPTAACRSLARMAATTALVAVGGSVVGTGLTLAAAPAASADSSTTTTAPTPPATTPPATTPPTTAPPTTTPPATTTSTATTVAPATTAPPDPPAHGGWDGERYWFQNDGAWRWTSHYDVYLRYAPPADALVDTSAATTGVSRPSAAVLVETALTFATEQIGKPYIWGGNGPRGYDCSGLVQQAFRRAGIHLPRVAWAQYRASQHISADELRRGDLLFWSYNGRTSGIHHVALYLGGGRYIEAPRPGKHVRVSRMSRGYYPTEFGRVVH